MESENQSDTRGGGERWLDQRKNIDLVFWGLVGTCAVLVVLQIAMDPHDIPFGWQKWPGIFGGFGYVAFLGIVLAGKYLRRLVMREEDYYVR